MIVSVPAPPLNQAVPLVSVSMSLPSPPSSRSLPVPPLSVLTAALPRTRLANVLPVPLIALVPVSIRFSTLLARVSVTLDSTVSVPALAASVTTSVEALTM